MAQDVTDIWSNVRDSLRAFVAKRVGSEAEVDDILQEVFLRVHRKLDSLKDSRRVVSWLFQITRHTIVDHYRAPVRKREVPAGLASEIDSAHPASTGSVSVEDPGQLRAELAGCLKPMIEKLSDEYREAIALVELKGLTQNVAAKRLGLSVSGVKSRVQRGRRQLKQMLDDCCLIQLDQRRSVTGYAMRNSQANSCGCTPATMPPRSR